MPAESTTAAAERIDTTDSLSGTWETHRGGCAFCRHMGTSADRDRLGMPHSPCMHPDAQPRRPWDTVRADRTACGPKAAWWTPDNL